MKDLRIIEAKKSQKEILRQLLELYQYDLSIVTEGCAYKFIGTQQPYERHCEPVNSIWH